MGRIYARERSEHSNICISLIGPSRNPARSVPFCTVYGVRLGHGKAHLFRYARDVHTSIIKCLNREQYGTFKDIQNVRECEGYKIKKRRGW